MVEESKPPVESTPVSVKTPLGNLLIVDDEAAILRSLERIFTREGYSVKTSDSGQRGMELVEANEFDVVMTDVMLPDISGIEILKKCKEANPETEVIVITGYATVSAAVDAIKLGAFDYIEKPFETNERVLLAVSRAMEHRQLLSRARNLEQVVGDKYRFENIVGSSAEMQEIFSTIRKLSGNESSVLIEGESGTGKELIAKAIHFNSPRKGKPFVPVNCSALPSEIIESELFGHMKGSFTGAFQTTKGLFRQADGGTIFLDEIGEIPPQTQVKLLRALQEREIKPVGASESASVNVRVIAATNRNLRKEIATGRFREDLYYRLNVVSIHVPALRNHLDELPLLIDHFIIKFNAGTRKFKGIDAKALKVLQKYTWPGNVRELENMVERAYALAPGPAIRVEDLPKHILDEAKQGPSVPSDTELSLEVYEKLAYLKAMEEAKGDIDRAAQLLRVGKSTFYRKLKQYDLTPK
jgi:DNA-binding NtrC family response regulator